MQTNAEILAAFRAQAESKREEVQTKLSEVLQRDDTDLSEEEQSYVDTRMDAIEKIEQRADRLQSDLKREAAAKAAAEQLGTGGAVVTREEAPYSDPNVQPLGPSYFRDLHRARNRNDRDAMERLERNNRHVEAYSERAALSTANGAGGEFVPPLWLEQEFVPLARPHRIMADACNKMTLPEGTDSINIPKVATGTAVALQGYPGGGQNTGIQETDLTTTSIGAGVYTVAGGQTVSMQLIEQSPLNVDRVVLEDLGLAYGIQIDNFVFAGTGTNQPTGLLVQSGTNSISVSGSLAPTVTQLQTALAQAMSNITKKRFAPPTHIVMSPSRWAWALTLLDGQGRPLFVPDQQGPWNALGLASAPATPEGRVGSWLNLPVFVDPNMPANLGAGTNQDSIVMARASDLWLWEGRVRAEAFEQTYAQNLSLFIRLYNYMAFQPGRYPQSISVITGTAFQQSYIAGF